MPELLLDAERYKIDVGFWLERFGARKWAKERALHMPERFLAGWCAHLTTIGIEMTPEKWRMVEERLVALLYDGLLLRTDGE